MKINSRTGAPYRIAGMTANMSKYGIITQQELPEISEKFLVEYAELFQIGPKSLVLEKAENRKGRWYVNYKQEINGIPVYGSSVGFTVFQNGNIPLVGINYYPEINIDPIPKLSKSDAFGIAERMFTEISGADSIIIREGPDLYVLPEDSDEGYKYRLVYRLRLDSAGGSNAYSQTYFINAASGDIVQEYSNIKRYTSISGTVSIKYWPENPDDNPTPSTTGAEYLKVKLYEEGGEYLGYDYTNSSGYYYLYPVTELPIVHVIFAALDGQYAMVEKDHILDPTMEKALLPGSVYNWTWNASSMTNAYYHVNRIHDFIKGSPFNYTGMDYKMEVQVEALYNEEIINAIADGYNLWFGKLDNQAWAKSSDVIYHEYTHNIVYHLYGHRFIEPDDDQHYTPAAAMDEGFSDYFACTLNNESLFGESVDVNRQLSNDRVWRDYPYDDYWNGAVIGGACWDLRGYIGVSLTDELVFDALEMTPHAYYFDEFLDNVLYADDNDGNVSNGTPNIDDILQAFYNHEIYPDDPSVPPITPTLSPLGGDPGENPVLTWTNGGEPDLDHFIVKKKYYLDKYNQFTYYVNVGLANSYTDLDFGINPSGPWTAKYWVKAVDATDNSSPYSNMRSTQGYRAMPKAIVDLAAVPEKAALHPAYPNPFNPLTTIRYDLPEASSVSLMIYDMMGREVRSWHLQEPAGYRQVVWDGKDQSGRLAPTGIYIYRLVANSTESDEQFAAARKMVLMK